MVPGCTNMLPVVTVTELSTVTPPSIHIYDIPLAEKILSGLRHRLQCDKMVNLARVWIIPRVEAGIIADLR